MSVPTARRTAVPALAAGAAALVLVGAARPGPGAAAPPIGSEGPTDPARAAADTTVVGMTNSLKFTPDSVRVPAGGTVVWKNTSVLVHTATAVEDSAADPAHVRLPDGAEPFGSGRLEPGDTFRHTFEVPGTYRYVCLPHEAAAMIGTVVVEER